MLASTVVFADGFEGSGANLPGWSLRTYAGGSAAPKWGPNNVKVFGGGRSAFSGGAGRSTYSNDQHTGLVRERVSLAGFGSASLSFKYYLNTEAGYDFFSVNVIDASARSAKNVFRDSGDERSAGWQARTVDLSAFAGRSNLGIEFRFDSDRTVTRDAPSGVWVDDVRLRGDTKSPTGTIRGTLFDDADGDRTRDAGESPLAGWTVYLDRNQNRRRDSNETWRTTDSGGRYAFEGLIPGTHYVASEPKAGHTQTSPTAAEARAGGEFDITLHYGDTGFNSSRRNAFEAAARRWERVIVGDLPDVEDDGDHIDDVWLDAVAAEIDGRGGVLAQASPSAMRDAPSGSRGRSGLPYRGFVEIDVADIAALERNGTLGEVLTHEMGHALGFGTLWEQNGLVKNLGSDDPRFTGPVAVAQYRATFDTSASSVPLEGDGAPGTRDSHWRESAFGRELMSGYIDPPPDPISRVTVGSFADLGYVVDLSAADAFVPRGGRPVNPPAGVARAVTVSAGKTRSGIDFGFRAQASGRISGTVFRDADGDGTRDAGERAFAGSRVYLDLNGNDRFDSSEPNVLSDSGGNYAFTGLAARSYTVRSAPARGFVRVAPSAGAYNVKLGSGQSVSGKNFGLAPEARITGRVFQDADRDGARDSAEAGAAGWRVYLDANNNGRFDAGEASTNSGSNGTYTLPGLRPGRYTVRLAVLSGWTTTSPSAGVYQNVALAPGQNRSGNNFGVRRNGNG